jgi:hypothetical protein
MKKLLISAVVCTAALMCGAAYAGFTPWFDRDNPSGKGDYEDTKSLFSISCRFKDIPTAIEFSVFMF